MIKDNQKYFNRLHVWLDMFITIISYITAWWLRLVVFSDEGAGVLSQETYFGALLVIVPVYMVLYSVLNLYKSKRYSSNVREIFDIVRANSIGLLLFFVALYIVNEPNFSRSMIFIFGALNTLFMILMRSFIRVGLRNVRKKGYNRKYILLVGYSRAAEEYIDRIMANPEWGYVVRAILDDTVPAGTIYRGVKVVGRIDNLYYVLPENKLDEIAITLSLKDYDRLEEIVAFCEKSGVHTKFVPDYNSVIPTRPYTEDLYGLPVINIRRVPLTNTLNWVIKRIVDIIGAIVAIIIFSPIMIISAILIKASGDGPVIFSQERVGLHNKTFKMYKFRTMMVQDSKEEKKAWTTKDDPRVTKIGRILRKTSMDEVPQFFNILKGDMSLVGPRPERPFFVDKYKEEIPRYMVKHQVRPGLTGWAQVNGYRGDSSIRKRIDHDIYYIENWSLGFDVKILFLTFFRGFINKNAY
ncbi:MAG: undecaprenyl-phosphate glucose phosphotransferase [Lachnospiraceae bacterium]|nr:undecaprenyl-phosphate glucose phosphotransferase [Lachnospiraceae bacterium]